MTSEIFALSVGRPWPETLPPGNTFGTHHDSGTGLMFLAAAHDLTEPEIRGFKGESGPASFAVAPGPGDWPTLAWQFPGWGWCDTVVALLDSVDDDEIKQRRDDAAQWATQERSRQHLLTNAVLVDRDHGDIIVAMRLFTLSPRFVSVLGRRLTVAYKHTVSESDYAQQVLQWQNEHPDAAA